MNRITLMLWILIVAVSPHAHASTDAQISASILDPVLCKYVDDAGLVDYAGLLSAREDLDRFVRELAETDPSVFGGWNESEQMAFLLNAYNGLTLKLIIDHYPIQSSTVKSLLWPRNSIRQIKGAWNEITFELMGEAVTLDHIEHGILRTDFHDPRIHMALVCAALSCPPLRAEAYRGDKLEEQLDDQSRRFVSKQTMVSVDRRVGIVRISAIFDWFGSDFVERYPTGQDRFEPKREAVLEFIANFVDEDAAAYVRNGTYEVKFFDYDWTLNEPGKNEPGNK
jgi:hypothetical protein